ncbi:MAG: ComF family protein [Akkermansiaceae bacterium]
MLDFIYPAYCHLCSSQLSHGECLCGTCHKKLESVNAPFCAKCGECFDGDIGGEFICPNCHGLDLSFSFARAAYLGDGNSRQLIHDFKYSREIHLASELARLTSQAFDDIRFEPYLKNGLLVPVPLHWIRHRKRRFNQSEEIAKHISSQFDVPWSNALSRIRNTETQTRFSRKKRLKNLRGAFRVKRGQKSKIAKRNIILVDDVFTTGSTANECSRILLESGANDVAVLTLLRG